MTDHASRLQAGIAADLLEQGRLIHQLAVAVALATVLAAFLVGQAGSNAVVALSIAAGLFAAAAETVLAVRVGFDAALFRRLGDTADLAAFDRAMEGAGLMPAGKAGRPLEARVRGARRLLVFQGLALAVQLAFPVLLLLGRLP